MIGPEVREVRQLQAFRVPRQPCGFAGGDGRARGPTPLQKNLGHDGNLSNADVAFRPPPATAMHHRHGPAFASTLAVGEPRRGRVPILAYGTSPILILSIARGLGLKGRASIRLTLPTNLKPAAS